jgi:hypothetical protein
MFGDVELDAALPHAGFRTFFCRRADKCWCWMFFFQVFTNGNRLAKGAAIVQFKRWHLTAGILVSVGWFAVICCHEINLY